MQQQKVDCTLGLLTEKRGGAPLIKSGSIEDHIIDDWMEAGLGFCQTTILVNKHCLDCGLIHVGRNCVMNAFRRM